MIIGFRSCDLLLLKLALPVKTHMCEDIFLSIEPVRCGPQREQMWTPEGTNKADNQKGETQRERYGSGCGESKRTPADLCSRSS